MDEISPEYDVVVLGTGNDPDPSVPQPRIVGCVGYSFTFG